MNPNANALMERAIQDEMGASRMEIVRLRATLAAQAGEIARLKADMAKAAEKAPELPLQNSKEGAQNGAHH